MQKLAPFCILCGMCFPSYMDRYLKRGEEVPWREEWGEWVWKPWNPPLATALSFSVTSLEMRLLVVQL